MINNHKRRNAIIAAASGVALLLGGSTYALWSQTAQLTGGTITAGDLNITAVDDSITYWDISPDRSDSLAGTVTGTDLKGHAIDSAASWLAVPMDQVAFVLPYTLTLKGDNLVADLTVDLTALDAMGTTDFTFTDYAVYDATGKPMVAKTALSGTGKTTLATYQADSTGQSAGLDDGTITKLTTDGTGTATVSVVLFGTFADVDARTDANSTLADLTAGVVATLTQVRTPAVGNFVDPTATTTP